MFEAYLANPHLIDERYRDHAERVYKSAGVEDDNVLRLITTRNYVAGMTDPYATDQHARLFMSPERVRFS